MEASGLPEEIGAHYEKAIDEDRRIRQGLGELELVRTKEILRRHFPDRSLRVLDVGGGTGVHAEWLLTDGHQVHLVEPVRSHVERSLERLGSSEGFSAEVGDARGLRQGDQIFDAVLLLGPLYHLTDRSDRLQAWREARRVVTAGGLVFGAAISRFASLFDGLSSGYLFDEEFRSIVARDLEDGQHRNPGRRVEWFTTAYFHHPDELETEALEAGLLAIDLVGVEGLAVWLTDLEDRWADTEGQNVILDSARAVESEPSLRGLSAHLILISQRPGEAK